jgi:Phage integrase, N-terminal SAM-like domain
MRCSTCFVLARFGTNRYKGKDATFETCGWGRPFPQGSRVHFRQLARRTQPSRRPKSFGRATRWRLAVTWNGFLTELAVKGRVSVATQQQALNALVILFREALGGDSGDPLALN